MKEDKAVNVTTEERIKKDNRKAGKKFVLILLVSSVIGLIAGFVSAWMTNSTIDLGKIFETFMANHYQVIGVAIPTTVFLLTLIISVWSIWNIKYCKEKAPAYIETDDEEALTGIEEKLSYNLWATSLLMIMDYLLFSSMTFIECKYKTDGMPKLYMYTIIAFVASSLVITVLQQKIVDCVRVINPEKRGSVYDVNFNKKWEESCDEAEKLIIYKAAYKAYKAVTYVCMALWVIFMIVGINTGSGFLAVVAVIIIWAVLVSVYSYYSIKYSK